MAVGEIVRWLPVAITLTGVGAGWATMKIEVAGVKQIRTEDMARVVDLEKRQQSDEVKTATQDEKLDALRRGQENIERKLDELLRRR